MPRRTRARAEFALIPAGGANNVARSLGIPVDFDAAARLAVQGAARSVDAIRVDSVAGRYLAVEGVSVGFHAFARTQYTAKNSTDKRPRSAPASARSGTSSRRRWRSRSTPPAGSRPTARSSSRTCRSSAPASRSPADPADALLDVVTIEGGRRAVLGLVRHLRRGTHLGRPGVSHVRARRIKIATRGRSPIVADTTYMGDTVELTVEPQALDIVGGAA